MEVTERRGLNRNASSLRATEPPKDVPTTYLYPERSPKPSALSAFDASLSGETVP
jgi:hypothetical protein